jgi:DNA-binding NarL/FixJ family response regulator
MKRLLIIGSREFIVDAMDFVTSYGPGLSVLGVVDNSSTNVVEDVRQARPDIIVVDGVADLTRASACLSKVRPEAADALLVVVVDEVDHDDVARALDAGIVVCAQPACMRTRSRGVRPEPGTALPVQIASGAAVGESVDRAALTSREREIMGWVASGHTNAWIGRRLWVTEQTVKFHLTNIFRKLGVANRTEASHYAIQHGLVSRPGDHDQAGPVPPATPGPFADASVVRG